jgi:hypothetical protein
MDISRTPLGRFIREQYDGTAAHVVLAHLSSKNNHPEIAKQRRPRLKRPGFMTTRLTVTSQDEPTSPIRL